MESHLEKPKSATTLLLLCSVTLIIGIVSGLSGMLLARLLHAIQHLAYGYSHTLINPENFLEGVTASSVHRRITGLSLCGVIAGFGWWAVYRYGKPLVSIDNAVKSNKPYMPIGTTAVHAVLQIITVGLGSPLGREVAPREIGASFACWLSTKTGLNTKEAQIMVACGAGAGLAAVYNIPLGGAMFTLEVLLCTLRWSALLPAIATSVIATVVSWIGLGNEPQYHIPNFTISFSLVIWSIIVGPLFGFCAFWFNRIANNARKIAPHNWKLTVLCILNFVMIGFLAAYFPALLGNGKGPIQLGFDNNLDINLAATLLILRILIVWTTLRAGASGGLLTPSLANGVLLATTLGGLWSLLWPGTPTGAFSVVGAAAFLAASQRMPITAVIITAEFTSINFSFLIPILFAVTGAVSVTSLCAKNNEVAFVSQT